MTRAHALRALALGAVLALATSSAAWGILFYRPLPTIDGYFRLLGLHERAVIVRDVFGAPHVTAADAHDLYFLQGYVTAQDRLAQMEQLREAARGRAAGGIATPASREALEAYAEGVSKYISQYAEAEALPGELVLAGRRPRPWTADDPAAIAAAFLVRAAPGSVCAASANTLRGRPLLAADLYLDVAEPGWYVVGLGAGTTRAVGASLPGVPGILAGHNGWIAWSMAAAADAAGALDVAISTLEHQRAEPAAASFGWRGASGCLADVEGAVVQRAAGSKSALVGAERVDVESARVLLGRPEPSDAGLRLIIDLAEVEASRVSLSTGESGQRASPHHRDEAALWEVGQVRRLPFARPPQGLIEGELTLRAR